MIKNEHQYALTKAQAEKFVRALERLKSKSAGVAGTNPLLLKAEERALRSQLAALRSEMKAFEALRSGDQHE